MLFANDNISCNLIDTVNVHARCVTKQTELPKYKKIRENYEKTSFLQILIFCICNKFCVKSFAERSPWILAYGTEYGLLVQTHKKKNALTRFALSLPKTLTRHCSRINNMSFFSG
jgi:hypothetical protein